MTIETALKKIDTLSKEELIHCIQRIDTEIKYYKFCIRNYSPDKMKKYGIPFIKRLETKRETFNNKLSEL